MGLTNQPIDATASMEQASAICPGPIVYTDEIQEKAAKELEACPDCTALASMIADLAVLNWQSMVCVNPNLQGNISTTQGETGK